MSSPQGAPSPCLPAVGVGYLDTSSPNPSVPPNQSGVHSQQQQQEQPLIDLDEPFDVPSNAGLNLPSHAATSYALDRSSPALSTPLNTTIPPLAPATGNVVADDVRPLGSDASVGARGFSSSALDDISGANQSNADELTARARQLSLPVYARGLSPNSAPSWSTRSGHPSVGLSSINVQQQFAGMSISDDTRTSRSLSETLSPESSNGASSRATPQSTPTLQTTQHSSLNPFRNRLLQQKEAQQQSQQQHSSPFSVSPLPVSPSPAPPLVQTQSSRPSRMSSEYVPPPWQPDSEVFACPICHHEFSFWYRKHHCRKCGRVVCANCSPHRITIPRQYIVRPPNQEADSPGQASSGFPGSAHTNRAASLRRSSIEYFPRPFDGQQPPPRTQEEADGASVSLTGPEDHNQTSSEQPVSTPDSFFSYFTSNHRPVSQSSATVTSANIASAGNPALGGGEEVRLCNPCVPDPNLEPPADHQLGSRLYDSSASTPSRIPHDTTHTNSLLDIARSSAGDGGEQSHSRGPVDGGLAVDMRSNDATTRSRHSINHYLPDLNAYSVSEGGMNDIRARSTSTPVQQSTRNQTFDSMLAGFNLEQQPQRTESRRHHFSRHADNRHHDTRGGRSLPALASSAISSRLTRERHSRSGQSDVTESQTDSSDHAGRHHRSSMRHRRRIAEEDICPVCSRPLPPRGPHGSEAPREEHVSACIENATAALTGGTSTPAAVGSDSASSDPNTVHGPNSASTSRTVSVPSPSSPSSRAGKLPSKNAHLMRMLSFSATEKDCCLTSDGQPQECTICMEEYSMGERLARLECLCKFHKKCIVEWFERKPECPVHKTPSWEEP